jgi:hypothetical protein
MGIRLWDGDNGEQATDLRSRSVKRQTNASLIRCTVAVVWLTIAMPLQSHAAEADAPRFGRHVLPLLSKLGCNGGACHGAVQGKNGFRLSLFGADPKADHLQLAYGSAGRRIDLIDPSRSLFLLKATHQVPHEGGKLIEADSFEFDLLRRWVAAGAPVESEPTTWRVRSLRVTPAEQVLEEGKTARLKVEATFADGSTEEVTRLCSFESRDRMVVAVDRDGTLTAGSAGDAAVIVRYRDEPVAATVLVPRAPGQGEPAFPQPAEHHFIDDFILAKLRRLNIPPSPLADDETFLRRASLDITGSLPAPQEVRDFVKSTDKDKRAKKIDELLARPGHAALWTLKFCDLLKATDFGVYADGLKNEDDAPRFAAWIRARLQENTPYDQFVERILLATSRDGRSIDEWSKEVERLYELSTADWGEHPFYSQRKSLDLYWQRKGANGVSGTLQVAHAFLGLRLECAQCHRHPHDVWQQDDLLSFANFFARIRRPGFEGDNEKKYPDHARVFKAYEAEGKRLEDEVKRLKANDLQVAAQKMNQAKAEKSPDFDALKAEHDRLNENIRQMERRSKYLKEEVAKRILHADIFWHPDGRAWASVDSPLGTAKSTTFRLLGSPDALNIPKEEDPRHRVMDWMRRPDNPYFAKAIVNRVWAHYFGRGIVNPPDHLSPLNPPTHPQLLDELCRQFITNKYDLRWLHRTIATSRTYQLISAATSANAMDRSNYAYFYFRRLPAEVLVDAIDQATGTREKMDMKYWRWPDDLRAIEAPFTPQNKYVVFMFEQFGKPKRNLAVQCDCEREADSSVLQVMSLANHPRVLQKIADPTGAAAKIAREAKDDDARIEEVFLTVLSRSPTTEERQACRSYLRNAESADKGVQGILWSLLNTREFLLQH